MSVNSEAPTSKMQQEWDHRSRENAFHYIASGKYEWREDEFLLSGERDVREFVDPYLSEAQFAPQNKRMVEIGCGVGRMSFALAKRFETVDAIDISSEMIKRAKELQARLGIDNVRFHAGDGSDLGPIPDASIDFGFSYIVFQHIPEVSVILNYVLELGRVLKPGGLFRFQLNGYHRWVLPGGYCLMWGSSPLRWAKSLHRPHVRFGKLNSWRGTPVGLSELQGGCAAAGLTITKIEGMSTKRMWVNGRKG